MKGRFLKLTALLVMVCVLFSGCFLADAWNYLFYGYYPNTPFSQMEYQRPDVDALKAAADKCAEQSKTARNVNAITESMNDFSTRYSDFATQYMLAYIHYCQDMTDKYWEKEYHFCEENTAAVEAARDQLMHALADSSLREELEEAMGEGWYEDYEGDSFWTTEFQSLIEQEAKLETEYYDLYAASMESDLYGKKFYDKYAQPMEELYVQLVKVRWDIAQEAGYDNYPEFAYDYYYGRDFTVKEAITYCKEIADHLVPLFESTEPAALFPEGISASSEKDTFGYVQTASNSMGGKIQEAFEKMQDNELYDIAIRDNKFSGSYEVYLYNYMEPYVFVGPTGTVQDKLSFTHEFGHFCNDYVSQGSIAGIDVAEVFSQGLEYLSLSYANADEELKQLKMYFSLATYVEQAAFACFEQQVYGLAPEELTVENIRTLYQRTAEAFGLDTVDFDSRMYVDIQHFYTQPMYVISYVVSNDAAMQLYQMESAKKGSGLKVYEDSLDTQQEGFLAYLKEAKLESPFKEGRIEQVEKTFKEVFG